MGLGTREHLITGFSETQPLTSMNGETEAKTLLRA